MNANYYILLCDIEGKQAIRFHSGNIQQVTKTLPAGTLVCHVDLVTDDHDPTRVNFITVRNIDSSGGHTDAHCQLSEIQQLDPFQYEMLVSVSDVAKRLEIALHDTWLKEGANLKKDDFVMVSSKPAEDTSAEQKSHYGHVRYKGPIADMPGVYFGVELLEPKGTTDGRFKDRRYFTCNSLYGVFATLYNIRLYSAITNPHGGDMDFDSIETTPHVPNTSDNLHDTAAAIEIPCLKIGDRVVWMSPSKHEYATVRWIGLLGKHQYDSLDDVTIGVEFDNPIGTGTGRYHSQRLFKCKQNHASLIPLLGLVKADDIAGSKNHHLQNGGREAVNISNKPSQRDAMNSRNSTSTFQNYNVDRSSYSQAPRQYNNSPSTAYQQHSGSPPQMVTRSSTRAQKQRTETDEEDLYKKYYSLRQDIRKSPANFSDHKENAKQPTTNHTSVNNALPVSGSRNFSTADLISRAKAMVEPDLVYAKSVNVRNFTPRERGAEGGAASYTERYEQKARDVPKPKYITISPDNENVKRTGLEVGCLAEVETNAVRSYGVVRSIGCFEDRPVKVLAGLEMEDEVTGGNDGLFRSCRLFTCPPNKGLVVPIQFCKPDRRFRDEPKLAGQKTDFGHKFTPDIPGKVKPPRAFQVPALCGTDRGIQGHHNSCYLDATLFSMYYFDTVFDTVFYRKKRSTDIPEYTHVRKALQEGIVNPLRRNYYVRADKVMKFRELLDNLGQVSGMMSEEKDPEEFLNLFLSKIMKADPFVKLTSGTECFYYQLFFEKDDRLTQPTTQQLFELSFYQSNIKLCQVPASLILQMPRHGKEYKMYNRIIPSLQLNITDVLEDAPRECTVCGKLAYIECRECWGQLSNFPSLSYISYCQECFDRSHSHPNRKNHRPQAIKIDSEYLHYRRSDDVAIRQETMELTAVMCIETSHYVTFVRCGSGPDAPWVFFDSMADRKGGQSGYNIPQVSEVKYLSMWLSEEHQKKIMQVPDRNLPEHLKRLVCDSYMCFYKSVEASLFV